VVFFCHIALESSIAIVIETPHGGVVKAIQHYIIAKQNKRFGIMKKIFAIFGAIAFSASAASAEVELSFYTGLQSAPHSGAEGTDPGGLGDFSFNAGWEGKSMSPPPYYGVRATWWRNENLGFGADFTHAKIYADSTTLSASGFDRLEFTDGLNFLTGNIYYRWPSDTRRWTPYVGAGAGVAIPHVDIESFANKTFGYQVVGPTIQLTAGVSYQINDKWSVFGEYKGNYTQIDADLSGGGSFETDVITNAVNIGLGFRF